MKALIVQLTDIHIKRSQDAILSRGKVLAAAITEYGNLVDLVLCIVSGDIAYSGKREEYDLASAFLEEIKDESVRQTGKPFHFVFAPGNHDCDFDAEDLSVRDVTIDGLLAKPVNTVSGKLVDCCTCVQRAYFDFRETLESREHRTFADSLFTTHRFEIGSHSVVVDSYNVAWLSRKQEVSGRLYFPFAQYQSHTQSDSSIRLAVFHHPFNWYAPGEHREFFSHIRRCADIAFTGHEHENSASQVADLFGDIKDTEFVQGTALFLGEHDPNSSGFNAILVDFTERTHLVVHYKLIRHGGSFAYTRHSEKDNWEKLPAASRTVNEFEISKPFRTELQDSGALFRHPRKDTLSLDDFYVYPDIRFMSTDEMPPDRVSAKILEDTGLADKYLLVRGEEKAGKTSLLYRLFFAFHSKGCVPVFLDGSELTRSSDLELRKCVSRAVERQYGSAKASHFFQLPMERRILLLDNVERAPVNEKYRHGVITYAKREFGRLVFTSNDLVRFEEFFTPKASATLAEFREIDIQRFGHRLRYDLIDKWNSIGLEETLAEGERIARNEKARKIVDQVIGKHFVPSLPLFLVTVLQTVDGGGQTELQQNGFGHYYHFLIVLAFRQSKVKEQEINELFNYLEQLAFLFFDKKQRTIPEEMFREFNDWFSSTYTRVELKGRQDLLCRAKILTKSGSAYSFRYPYVFYYFVALHLASSIDEHKERVRYLCKHVHVSEYANILLFLSHHTRDLMVVNELLEIAKSLFSDERALRFDVDISHINELVTDLPQLFYRSNDPVEYRRRELDSKDKHEDPKDPLEGIDPNSEIETLSVPAKMLLMFKLVEILGQIVRNYYGALKKPLKVDILQHCYTGPLRTLAWLFRMLAAEPAYLVEWIVRNLHEDKPTATEEQKRTFARRLVFWMLGFAANNYISRISDAVSSENLAEECQMVLAADGSVANRLVDISNKLSLPGAIPFSEIEKLADELKGNTMAFRILQGFAYRHLHMFKTSDREKQKLCDSLKIEVKVQRGIDLQTKNTKLLTSRK